MPETVEIQGKEVLSTGLKHASTGDVKFSARELDQIVESFSKVGSMIRAPLKLGHNVRQKLAASLGLPEDEDGFPALGHIANLYRKGEKLFADFAGVPTKLRAWLDAGMWPTVSLELRTVRVNGKEHPWTPTGVALCGDTLEADSGQSWFRKILMAADTEGVEGEEPIYILASAKPLPVVDTLEAAIRARPDDGAGLADEAEVALSVIEGILEGDLQATRDEIVLLTAALELDTDAVLERAAAEGHDLQENIDTMDPDILAALGLPPEADKEAVMARIAEIMPSETEELAEGEEEETMDDDGSMAGLKADLKAADDRVAELTEKVGKLEANKAKADAEALVEEHRLKIAPAARDEFIALALDDYERTKTLLEKSPEIVKLGEEGTSEELDDQIAELAPTELELETDLKVRGLRKDRATPEQIEEARTGLMLQKAKDEGIHTPALETKLKANLKAAV